MAFDELQVENIDSYVKRYLSEKSQILDEVKSLNNAKIDYCYNCSGFQDKVDDVILNLYKLVNGFENEFIKEYRRCEQNENEVQDIFYGMHRLSKIIKNIETLDLI